MKVTSITPGTADATEPARPAHAALPHLSLASIATAAAWLRSRLSPQTWALLEEHMIWSTPPDLADRFRVLLGQAGPAGGPR